MGEGLMFPPAQVLTSFSGAIAYDDGAEAPANSARGLSEWGV